MLLTKRLLLAVYIPIGFSVSAVVAQDMDDLLGLYQDESLISIATGQLQLIHKAPAVASVVTASDIKSLGAVDIDDVLETIPGLHVGKDTVYGSIYSFRGVYADFNPQVLVLVNGIPITNLFQGDRGLIWGGMPVEAISRIEIIRGPGSALYGADAFAGVINIVTKTPEEIGDFTSGIRYGSYDTKDVWLGFSGGDELRYSAILEFHKTDGSDEQVVWDAQSLLDLITGTSASNAPGQVSLSRENLDGRVEFSYRDWRLRAGMQNRDDVGDGAGAAQALNRENRFSSDRYNVDLTYSNKNFADDLAVEWQASYFSTTQEVEGNYVIFPEGTTGPFLDEFGQPLLPPFEDGLIGNPEVFEKHLRTHLKFDYHLADAQDLSVGMGLYQGEIYKVKESKNFGLDPDFYEINILLPILPPYPVKDVSDTDLVFLAEDNRDNAFGYVQYVGRLHNDWELTLGVRYDDYSDFGSTVNPRAALVWSTSYNLTTKFLYGEAFRAPSFAQTRAMNNPIVLGNIDLDPEEITSYEVAFDYRPAADLSLNANFFYYEWTDIIQYVPDANGSTKTAQNAGEQSGFGAEFEVAWDATQNLEISGNFSIQKSTDEKTNTDAAYSPEKQLYARINWRPAEQWQLDLRANWVMDRNRFFLDQREPVDDYLLVDATIRKTLSSNFEVALIVKNLFDEDAREPSPYADPQPFIPYDLPLPGTSVLAEIRYTY